MLRMLLGTAFFLVLTSSCHAALFGQDSLDPAFCQQPTARQTVVYIDDMMMVDGKTDWAGKLATKLRATLAPGERVTVVELSPRNSQSRELWTGCWPAFTTEKRADLAKTTYLFHANPLSEIDTQQKFFMQGLNGALSAIYTSAKRPLQSVRIDAKSPPTKNLIRALASDEGRFSQSEVSTIRAIIYSDMAENSDVGSVFQTDPPPDVGKKLGSFLRRSVFYAFGVGEDVGDAPHFLEDSRRFWRATLQSMNASTGGIGADLNMPNAIPVAAFIYSATVKIEGQEVDGILSLMTDPDGNLVDSWLGFGRLTISSIAGTFRCTGKQGDRSCRLEANSSSGIVTQGATEAIQMVGDDKGGLVGQIGVKGAVMLPLKAAKGSS